MSLVHIYNIFRLLRDALYMVFIPEIFGRELISMCCETSALALNAQVKCGWSGASCSLSIGKIYQPECLIDGLLLLTERI